MRPVSGGAVKFVVGAAVAAGIAWVAAPWVAMARHGTLDDEAYADMRAPVVPRQRTAPESRRAPTRRPEGEVV